MIDKLMDNEFLLCREHSHNLNELCESSIETISRVRCCFCSPLNWCINKSMLGVIFQSTAMKNLFI